MTTTKKTTAKTTVKKELFETTHNGVFIAGGVEFKQGVAVELTAAQKESVKTYIDCGMLKAV